MRIIKPNKPHIFFRGGRWAAEIFNLGKAPEESRKWIAAVRFVERRNSEIEGRSA